MEMETRSKYIYKEIDNESKLSDNGVRKYDNEIGRFLSIDKLWEKYYGWTPYQYSMNNPISLLDYNGKHVIELLDSQGANILGESQGHMAVLIGNDNDGWKFYSKNGGVLMWDHSFVGASEKPQDGVEFANLEEFSKALFNDDQGNELKRYDKAVFIGTTPEQDKKAQVAALEAVNSSFSLLGANCADVVSDVLSSIGLNPGSRTSIDTKTGILYESSPSKKPLKRFEDIKLKNKGIDVTPLLIPPQNQ